VAELFHGLEKLVRKVSLRSATIGWSSRSSYNAKPLNTFLEKLLRVFAYSVSLTDLYRLIVHLDPTLHDKGFKVVLETLLRLFKGAVKLASRDLDGYLAVIDTFVGADRTNIQ
jgi:hypothetical protein